MIKILAVVFGLTYICSAQVDSSTYAPTNGELKMASHDPSPFNGYLQNMPKYGRKVKQASTFSTDPKTPYWFYAVVNISPDTVHVSYGEELTTLEPAGYITGNATFDAKGRLLAPAPYISIFSDFNSKDLHIVYMLCTTCRYSAEHTGYNESKHTQQRDFGNLSR